MRLETNLIVVHMNHISTATQYGCDIKATQSCFLIRKACNKDQSKLQNLISHGQKFSFIS